MDAKNKRVLLGALVWASVALVGWAFFLGPDLHKLSLADTAKKEDAEKQIVLRHVAQLEGIRQTYRQRLAETNDVSWLVEALSQISKRIGVKISSITPLETQTVRRYEKISLRLNAKCGYHELGKFISQIESYDKLIKISEMNVRKKSDATSKDLDVTFVVSAFHAL